MKKQIRPFSQFSHDQSASDGAWMNGYRKAAVIFTTIIILFWNRNKRKGKAVEEK